MARILLLLIFYSFFALNSLAQSVEVTGKVIADEDGSGLAGASVLIKGTSTGTSTNIDGKFTIQAKPGATLIISYIGFVNKEFTITGKTNYEIALVADNRLLSELVVTAFGIERDKKALGYTVQEVKGSSLTESRSTNVANALSGKIAGVRIQSNGGPGSGSTIQIRGAGSISGNNQPLIVIDGIPMQQAASSSSNNQYGGGLSEINPDDIKDVSVLKGPNAAALYGSRAANGVILVTTKNGQGTKGVGVEINSNITFERPWIKPKFQNQYGGGHGYRTWYHDGWSGSITDPLEIQQYQAVYGTSALLAGTDGTDESWGAPMDGRLVRHWWSGTEVAPLTPQPNNWEEFWDTGSTLSNSIAISGGNDQGYFRLGFGQTSQKGIAYNNDFKRYNFKINSGYNFTKNFSASISAEYIKSGADNRGYTSGQEFIWAHRHISWKQLRDYRSYEGVHLQKPGDTDPPNWQHTYFTNPFFMQEYLTAGNDKDRLLGNVSLNYKFSPNLSIMLRTGTDVWSDTRITVNNFERVRNGTRTPGRYTEEVLRNQETNTDLMLTFNKNLNPDFSLNVQAGGIRRTNYYKRNYMYVGELVVDRVYNASNSVVSQNVIQSNIMKSEVQSIFGSAQLGWKNQVFLDLTARNDWSSTLPSNARSYFYPSASLSTTFTDLFHIDSPVLTFGKVRASIAQVGNDAEPYSLAQTFSASGSWNGSMTKFAEAVKIANSSLKPEITTGLEFGADLRFFGGKLGLDLTYYSQSTRDQILAVEISKATGYDSRVLNAGEVTNKGIEIVLSATPVTLPNGFSWNIGVNFAKNKNKVVALAEGLATFTLTTQRGMTSEARVNETYGTYYGKGWKRSPDGEIIYSNGLPQLADGTVKLGNIQPDWTGGITNTLNFKGFILSALVDVRMGGDIFDEGTATARWTGQYEETAVGREEGVIGKGVKLLEDGSYVPNDILIPAKEFYSYNNPRNYHEAAIFDASYVKLREVSIGYSLPKTLLRKTFFQSAKLSFVGRNVWMIFKNTPHVDPEFDSKGGNAQGFGYGQLPSSRSLGANLSFSF